MAGGSKLGRAETSIRARGSKTSTTYMITMGRRLMGVGVTYLKTAVLPNELEESSAGAVLLKSPTGKPYENVALDDRKSVMSITRHRRAPMSTNIARRLFM